MPLIPSLPTDVLRRGDLPSSLVSVTPSDYDDIPGGTNGLIVTGGGTLALVGADGTSSTITVPANTVLPGLWSRVMATGTTATGIFAQVVAKPFTITRVPFEVMAAPNIVILGASIQEYSFGIVTEGSAVSLKASGAALARTLGFQGRLVSRAVAGATVSQIITQAQAAVLEFPSDPAKPNVFIIDAGGNNVTQSRPWNAAQVASFLAGLTTLTEICARNGGIVIWVNLSKRLYPTAPAVLPGTDPSEENGSLPYNRSIHNPMIRRSRWVKDDGAPVFDFYSFTKLHELAWLRNDDGVHPHPGSFAATREWYLATLKAAATGAKNVSRAGRAYQIAPITAVDPDYSGAWNIFRVESQAMNNAGKGITAYTRDTTGADDLFMAVSTRGWVGSNTQGSGASAFPRVADVRLQDATVLGRSLFLDNTGTTASLRFTGLVPGDTGKLTLCASRAIAGTDRRADVTVQGTTKTLDAAQNAASNQQDWTFTVPADGIVEATFARTGGAGTAYFSGALIEFF